jgi:hypothetical protein
MMGPGRNTAGYKKHYTEKQKTRDDKSSVYLLGKGLEKRSDSLQQLVLFQASNRDTICGLTSSQFAG